MSNDTSFARALSKVVIRIFLLASSADTALRVGLPALISQSKQASSIHKMLALKGASRLDLNF